MNITVRPGGRTGSARPPASKSQLHRLLILAALGSGPVTIRCGELSGDLTATVSCLAALGADVRAPKPGTIRIAPIGAPPPDLCRLPCGQSASTLRFLLPLVGSLGAQAVFLREGSLPQRPLSPLTEELSAHGMELREEGAAFFCRGKLLPGDYTVPGNVSSQFVSGLLMALPGLPEESTLRLTGPLESAGYVTLTENVLARAGVRLEIGPSLWRIPGGQRPALPESLVPEGDWSAAAPWLCMGALSRRGVTVRGLASRTHQGDRAIIDILGKMGAVTEETPEGVTVRRGTLRGTVIDASQIPDLIPALCAVAAAAEGETRVIRAARLRLKESDRLRTTAAMLRSLGGDVSELPDGLLVRGRPSLTGGRVDSAGDHRIAMAAAAAACACTGLVEISGAESVAKSYPRFWEDLAALKEDEP